MNESDKMIKAEVTLELDASSLERIKVLANRKGKTIQEMAVSLLEKGIDIVDPKLKTEGSQLADSHEIKEDPEKIRKGEVFYEERK